ncbi:MAG: SH3 domain-containing protein [Alphaproteobacteria bacterium]
MPSAAAQTAKARGSETVSEAETHALNKTETTATQAANLQDTAIERRAAKNGNKLYALAGVAGDISLPIRKQPEDGAPVVAFIPSDAKDVEGLHKCSGKWCLIRHKGSVGWVQRRHLADESIESSQLFQVSGVALWSSLNVVARCRRMGQRPLSGAAPAVTFRNGTQR